MELRSMLTLLLLAVVSPIECKYENGYDDVRGTTVATGGEGSKDERPAVVEASVITGERLQVDHTRLPTDENAREQQ